MCSPGWGNLVAIDWNDLPVHREFDNKFLENVKSPSHALPCFRHLMTMSLSSFDDVYSSTDEAASPQTSFGVRSSRFWALYF